MSDIIRFDLTGKDSEAWNRVFASLTEAVEKAVTHLSDSGDGSADDKTNGLISDIAEITKTWVRSKMERPAIENQLKLAEIAARFEEIKTARVNREIAEVELDRKKLELCEKRLETALKMLTFFNNYTVRDDDGNVTLVLTNEQLSALHSNLQRLRQEPAK